MKLLFDQNLSSRLVGMVADLFPDSVHVRDVGLEQAGDATVWEYARDNGFVVISKDSDFQQRSFLMGAPPKVVWLRLGNCTTSQIEAVIRGHKDDLVAFEQDPQGAFLTLA